MIGSPAGFTSPLIDFPWALRSGTKHVYLAPCQHRMAILQTVAGTAVKEKLGGYVIMMRESEPTVAICGNDQFGREDG